MLSTSVISLLALLVVDTYATDYCNKNLCSAGTQHIGCNHNGQFASTCVSPSLVDFGTNLQDIVLQVHNEYRQNVANGSTQFSPASRMPRLRWNKELAQLAEYNVRQCAIEHDQCRNTDSFPYAGQNLGFWGTTATLTPDIINSAIIQIQHNWYAESVSTEQAWLDIFTSNTNGVVIGHFTAMIQDLTTDIGCASATFSMESGSNILNGVLVACDYSYTNMLNSPVYSKGPSASKCVTGRDTTYTSLCSLSEVV